MRSEPEVVVHELTALAGLTTSSTSTSSFALTNRLRTEGTDTCSRPLGRRARGVLIQSYGNWIYERGRQRRQDRGRTRSTRIHPANQVESLRGDSAISRSRPARRGARRDRRSATAGSTDPGRARAGGEMAELGPQAALPDRRRRRRASGRSSTSTMRAAATVAAVEHGAARASTTSSTTSPRRSREWLPELARALGAKPPRHVPVWFGRLAAGEVGVSMMTRIRGASNAKAKRELGWTPQFPSYREGFRRPGSASSERATCSAPDPVAARRSYCVDGSAPSRSGSRLQHARIRSTRSCVHVHLRRDRPSSRSIGSVAPRRVVIQNSAAKITTPKTFRNSL